MIGIADSHAIELNDFIAVKETTEPETMMMNAVSLNKEAVESLSLLHSAEAYAASVSLDARLAEAVLTAVPADILGNPLPLSEVIPIETTDQFGETPSGTTPSQAANTAYICLRKV